MYCLGHQVSLAGLEAHSKDLGSLVNPPFPHNMRAPQYFLGSLNYYSRFIEDFAIFVSVLYDLRVVDFNEILCLNGPNGPTPGVNTGWEYGSKVNSEGGTRWDKTKIARVPC